MMNTVVSVMNVKSKILMCDPDPQSEAMLKTMLESNGYEVESAYDGHDVIDKIKTLEYDLLLASSDMHAMDGFQVCRLLKESEQTRHVPAMILSSLSDHVTRNRAIESGADEFITKPFNRVELLSRVVALLRIKNLHDKLERLIAEKEEEKKKLAEKTNELQILSEIARIVISIKDQRGVLSEIINNIRETFQVEGCCLVTKSDAQWILEAISTNLPDTHLGKSVGTNLKIYDFIAHNEKPIIINDARADDRVPASLSALLQLEIRSTLCSPIFIRGKLIGVLQIINKRDKSSFESADLSLLMTLSGQIALAIENMQLFNKLTDFNKNLQKQTAEATQALVDLKNFNESILQNISSGLMTVDFSGKILFANRACKTILGYPEFELLDHRMLEIFGMAAAETMMKPTLDQDGNPGNAEIQITTKHQREIYLGYTTTVRYDSQYQMAGYIISFRDITQIKEMRATILRMDRLAASGVLTSAIAHEIRNPLAGIKTMAQALEKELTVQDNRYEYVHRIIKQINRLNELLKAFFTYAKPVRPEKRSCNLMEIVKDVKELLKERCEHDRITIEEIYDPFLPEIFVDVDQMAQVLLNLMMNAADAIGKSGKMTIHALLLNRPIPHRFSDEREVVEIRVRDTGKGISREQLKFIFDPFYTTKPTGIGLGLSIVYRIIHEHGGEVLVDSVEKQGTTFTLLLPLHEQVEQMRADKMVPSV
jgi:PAS domain S-box-containing protein